MFKEPGEGEESPPGDTVDDVLEDEGGPAMDEEGIDAILQLNGVGAASSSSSADQAPQSPGPSDRPPKDAVTPQKRHQEAAMLMMQGKRHLLVKDVNSAVNAYQEACRIMDEIYGQMAPQCGDVYLQYGQALLELARTENEVLGAMASAARPDDDDDDEDDDDDDEEEEEGGEEEKKEAEKVVAERKEEEEEDLEASAKEEIEGDVVKDKGKGPAPKKKKVDDDDAAAKEDDADDDDDGGENEVQDPEEEEEVTNLQLAWEMLELAKLVFLKDPEAKEKQIKAADCFLTLGEVSLESEAYEAAVDDFGQCLEIQRRHLAEDDRCIAETHYQLGLTHSFAKNYSDARLHFRHALKVLETRVANSESVVRVAVEKAGGSREKALKDEAVYKAKEEIEDLKGLLPEIRAKYEDAREMEAEHSEASQAVKEASENLHRSPFKANGASVAAKAEGSGDGAGGGSADADPSEAFPQKPVNASFTLPFPREEDGKKISFATAPSATKTPSTSVNMIAVRRNLNKESASSSSSSSSASASSSSSSSSFAASSLPSTSAVNDISSLVRRKRKTEDGTSSNSVLPVNGAGSSALTTNGAATNEADAGAAAPVNGDTNGTHEPKRVKINDDGQ